MNAITIRHTPAEGTLIEGSAKGDGVWEILRELRGNGQGNWRSSRDIGLYLGQSRDKLAQDWKIGKAAQALRAAGFEVTVEIDNQDRRPFADAEAGRYERAGERAAYHDEQAARAEGEAAARWNAERNILDAIPPGQPVLVGHHSERRHRRDLARADSHMRKGLEAVERGEYHQGRAQAAERYKAARQDLGTTLRRIAKLEAHLRRTQHDIDGTAPKSSWSGYSGVPAAGERLKRLELIKAQTEEELAYWRAHVASLQAEGQKVWGPGDFAKGDFALEHGTWHRVLRVNPKSLTVPHWFIDKATRALPYDEVAGRRSPTEMAIALRAETIQPAGDTAPGRPGTPKED